MRIGLGLSTTKDHLQAVKEALAQANAVVPQETADLVLVFSTTEFAHPLVLKTIAESTRQIPVVGCSSLALISRQGISKHGLLIVLIDLPSEIYYNTAHIAQPSTSALLAAGQALGEKLLYGTKGIHRDFGLLFTDGTMHDNSQLIAGLQERLGRSFPLIGASASDDLLYQRTYLYANQEVFNQGLVSILWGGKISFGLGVKHGWKPLGKPRHITRSDSNIVYEIDGAPAADIYTEYLDKSIEQVKKDLRYISVFYPIGMPIPGEQEYLLRNILAIQEDGSLVCQGNVTQGSTIRLMIGTKESCLTAVHEALDTALNHLPAQETKLALLFDSASRYQLLGRQASKELRIVLDRLGKHTVIAGIYSFGEQAPLQSIDQRGRANFHNQTFTILTMG
ncbi:MAG: FIST C-terminal domain-containing protein [Candidatus Omnitrophica bacterium]|nr:FIST C-terminal domain-containing protein [Candidatus Omnitrophota bacterium]